METSEKPIPEAPLARSPERSSYFSFYQQFFASPTDKEKTQDKNEKDVTENNGSEKEKDRIWLSDEAVLDEIRNNRDASLKKDLEKIKGLCVPDEDPLEVFPGFGHREIGPADDVGPPIAMSMDREKVADGRLHVAPTRTVSAPSWLARTTDTVKYTLISRQTEATLNEIIALIQKFFADVNVGYSDMVLGLLLLKVHPGNQVVRTDLRVERHIIADGYYYMKFAAAVYGWKLIYGYVFKKKTTGLYKGFVEGDRVNPKVLAEHTGVSVDDIIVAKWKSFDYDPGHYMVYDHSRGSIVIAIRGTFHIRDALTDLVATYEPFMEGFAHCGILRTARRKLETLRPYIVSALSKYPSYNVVVVGHSLGAGTAALLTLLIHSEFPDLPLRCHAFAPPCVLSLDLATRFANIISSYVIGDDIVPRLSYGSLEDLKIAIAALLAQEKSTFKRMAQVVGLAKPNVAAIIEQQEKHVLAEKLWPPGMIYHIYLAPNRNYAVEESSPSLFGQIIISYRMFLDHMPDLYEAALKELLDNWYTDPTRLSELKMERMLRDVAASADGSASAKDLLTFDDDPELGNGKETELEKGAEDGKPHDGNYTPLGYFTVTEATTVQQVEKKKEMIQQQQPQQSQATELLVNLDFAPRHPANHKEEDMQDAATERILQQLDHTLAIDHTHTHASPHDPLFDSDESGDVIAAITERLQKAALERAQKQHTAVQGEATTTTAVIRPAAEPLVEIAEKGAEDEASRGAKRVVEGTGTPTKTHEEQPHQLKPEGEENAAPTEQQPPTKKSAFSLFGLLGGG